MTITSTYSGKKILDQQVRDNGTTFVYSGTGGNANSLQLALFTGANAVTNLKNNNISNEVSGGSYARQYAIYANANVTAGTSDLSTTVTFPNATAAWGTITAVALLDGSGSTANVVFYTSYLETIQSGDQIKFPKFTIRAA